MKKKLFSILICMSLMFVIIGCSNSKTYTIDIFKLDEVSSITIDTLSQYDNIIEVNDKETIKKIYNIFNNKETNIESINDNPTNPEILFIVTFYNNEGEHKSSYIYKKNNKYYLEQPYNGIYESTFDDFKIIQDLTE